MARLTARSTQSPLLRLPVELLSLIIDEVAEDGTRSLYNCALICTALSTLSLARLYASLTLEHEEIAYRVARSEAFKRYRTTRLWCGGTKNSGTMYHTAVEKVLDGCEGLKELYLGQHVAVDPPLFQHLNLKSLEVLFLKGEVFGEPWDPEDDEEEREVLPPVNFRLRSLTTTLGTTQPPILLQILLSSAPTLKDVHVLLLDNSDLSALHLFLPVASHIKTLVLPPLDDPDHSLQEPDGRFTAVTTLLSSCTSLTHLGLTTDWLTLRQYLPSCLTRLFEAVQNPLQSPQLNFSSSYLIPVVFELLKEAMQPTGVLEKLDTLEFPEIRDDELAELKGCEGLKKVVDQNGIRVVCKGGVSRFRDL